MFLSPVATFPFARLTLGLWFCQEPPDSSLQRLLRRSHQLTRDYSGVFGILVNSCVVLGGCARPRLPETHDNPRRHRGCPNFGRNTRDVSCECSPRVRLQGSLGCHQALGEDGRGRGSFGGRPCVAPRERRRLLTHLHRAYVTDGLCRMSSSRVDDIKALDLPVPSGKKARDNERGKFGTFMTTQGESENKCTKSIRWTQISIVLEHWKHKTILINILDLQ